MASKNLTSLSIILAIAPLVVAQTFTAPTSCINGNGATDFAQCSSLYSTLNYCDGPSVNSGAPFIACLCNQDTFDTYYGCESDYRLCFGTNAEDLTLEDGIEGWHSICDAELSTTLTTPALSTILTSFNQDFCATAATACDAGLLSQSECSQSYASSDLSAWSSCSCQPKLLSLAYTCQVLGNTSCELIPGAVTNMAQYRGCTNILSVLGSPASTYANTTSSSMTPLSTSITNLSTATRSGSSQVSATTVVQTTLQGAPPAAPTASSTTSTKTSLGMRLSLPISSLISPTLFVALMLYM